MQHATSSARVAVPPHPGAVSTGSAPPAASGGSSGSHFVSPEQAASIQAMLAGIERSMRSDAQRVDASLSTPYPQEQARADYFALLSQIDALEAATQPLSSIAFDAEALSAHAAATAAAAASSAGAAPSAATAAAAAPRFLSDLSRMNASLKTDSAALQSFLQQLSLHTKGAAKDFRREAESSIKLGSVALQAQQQLQQQQQQQALAKAQQASMQQPIPLSRQQPMHR